MTEKSADLWFAPVFILDKIRFCWYNESLMAGSPVEAKKIGLTMSQGYTQHDLPLRSAKTVAKFRADGQYVLAAIGPKDDQRPIIVLNPADSPAELFDGGEEQRRQAAADMDPVEEIPYDKLPDPEMTRSVSWN